MNISSDVAGCAKRSGVAMEISSQNDMNEIDPLVVHGLLRTNPLRKMLVNKNGERLVGKDIFLAPLLTLSDTDLIHVFYAAFDKEFDFLASADAKTVEQSSRIVVGDYGPKLDKSPSQLLYSGKDHAEVNRTMIGVLSMVWILKNGYEKFAGIQARDVRLTSEKFSELRKLFMETLESSLDVYILIVSMVMNDLGKNNKLRKLIEHTPRWKVINHDEVLFRAVQLGKVELINEFEGQDREILEKGIKFAALLNLGQLAQGENVPGSLMEIPALMRGDKKAFLMKFCEVALDVAGASGHRDSRGAVVWTALVHESYMDLRLKIETVIQQPNQIREVYNDILRKRKYSLESKGYRKFSGKNLHWRPLLRLMSMARAYDEPGAETVGAAMELLRGERFGAPTHDLLGHPISNVYDALMNGLDVNGDTDGVAIIPYYLPGILAEVLQQVQKVAKEEREHGRQVDEQKMQANAMAGVFRFVARVMLGARSTPGVGGVVIECDIRRLENFVRKRSFIDNPKCLDEESFPVEECYSRDMNETEVKNLLHEARQAQAEEMGTENGRAIECF